MLKKNPDVEKAIAYAHKIVNTWPRWKQTILEVSSRSTMTIPRTPIPFDKGSINLLD